MSFAKYTQLLNEDLSLIDEVYGVLLDSEKQRALFTPVTDDAKNKVWMLDFVFDSVLQKEFYDYAEAVCEKQRLGKLLPESNVLSDTTKV